jgi:hypothetical protein
VKFVVAPLCLFSTSTFNHRQFQQRARIDSIEDFAHKSICCAVIIDDANWGAVLSATTF